MCGVITRKETNSTSSRAQQFDIAMSGFRGKLAHKLREHIDRRKLARRSSHENTEPEPWTTRNVCVGSFAPSQQTWASIKSSIVLECTRPIYLEICACFISLLFGIHKTSCASRRGGNTNKYTILLYTNCVTSNGALVPRACVRHLNKTCINQTKTYNQYAHMCPHIYPHIYPHMR